MKRKIKFGIVLILISTSLFGCNVKDDNTNIESMAKSEAAIDKVESDESEAAIDKAESDESEAAIDKAESAESEAAINEVKNVEVSTFIKDGIMYVRDGDGSCYPYNEGIYTDETTGEEFLYASNWELYEVAPEEFGGKSDEAADKVSKLEEEYNKDNKGNGVKIPLSKIKFDNGANRYYFYEDWVGRKEYYPEGGIWQNNDGQSYVYSKNGIKVFFNSLEEITE